MTTERDRSAGHGKNGTGARPLDRRTRPIRDAWFASDFHLHGDDPEGIDRALRFLRRVESSDADALFLLGDVFLAWLGPVSLRDPGLEPVVEALASLVEGGRRVVLVQGNHDFLMGSELERAAGVEVVDGALDVRLGGQRVRLCHGDGFCTRDVDYQRLHRVLRNGASRWLLRNLPQRAIQWIARTLVDGANRSTVRKPDEVMAIVDADVVTTLAGGVDTIVCGHVHRARDDVLATPYGEGRLVVLADFETTGSHARWADGRLVLHRRDRRPGAGPTVVAIDGPAGSGKSAVSRRLARRLGYALLDSGALYRTVTWRALSLGDDPSERALGELARSLPLAVDDRGRVLLEGHPVDDAELRSPAVSGRVSQVSAVAAVREALLPVQRGAAHGAAGLVAEGRDMATVVFPDAACSFYLDASPEVRAARRLAQNPGEGRSVEEVAEAIARRDDRDSGRSVAPLTRAPGAVVVDTSELTLDEVVRRLEDLVCS